MGLHKINRAASLGLRALSLILLVILLFTNIACQQEEPNQNSSSTSASSQEILRTKLTELLHLPDRSIKELPFTMTFLSEEETYTLYRVIIHPEAGDSIPTYFLKPKNIPPPYPVMICLQGHAPGMYISIGEARSDRDKKLIAGGRDIALQAIEHGWAALTVEQRAFGEQAQGELSCNHVSLNSAMQGKPMVGQRVSDISYAIDFLETQSDVSLDNLGCMGNSAGGTISYFAACVDTRIKLAVVSCSFCTYEKSWLKYPHCACGYLPGLLEFADMPDLAELIAPRNLLIIAGKEDYLADIEGVREGYQIAKGFYQQYNATNHVVLAEGAGGHQFYPELAWKFIDYFQEHARLKN